MRGVRQNPLDFPREGSLSPQISGWAAGVADTPRCQECPFPAQPYSPPKSRGREPPVALLGPSAVSCLFPTLITLVSTDVVQMHGGSQYPGPECNRRGQECWVWALMWGTPRSSLLSSAFDPSSPIQGGPQGPDGKSDSLFLKWLELVSLGLGILFSPISGESHSTWCLGSSLPSLPSDMDATWTVAGWRVMMSHRPQYY